MIESHKEPAVVLNPFAGPGWEAAVTAHPETTFFHGTIWARILAATYGFTPYYLTYAQSNGAGLLPIMEANSIISGRRGISLPFTDECEPAAADADSFKALFRGALAHFATRKWRYFEIRGSNAELSASSSTEFWGHEIPLHGLSRDEVFANCTSAARRAVRKAEKNGVTVEFGRTLTHMESFYRLLCQTRKRHGNPPQPVRFFKEIHRHAIEGNSGHLLLAKHNGAIVAGAVFFHHGRTAIYKFGASDSAYGHLPVNNLLMWRALEWYCQHGFSYVRLGRTSMNNDGLRRFKLGWGSREYPIKYFRYTRKNRGFVVHPDNSSGWQTRIFKILPEAVSRCVGAVAYRHIA